VAGQIETKSKNSTAPQGRGYRFQGETKIRTPTLRLAQIFDRSPLYFVTFCTHERIPCLALDEVHAAFVFFAGKAERDFKIAVGRYVIMSDHVHLFVRGGRILFWGDGLEC
jgi:hypothetical protein